ncbi:gamma-glutamyltransferase [Aneurinibacillus tyrosinisolvens]|uniref:gamma-glutamyltransferase n=1 Tax=Aneurinibacillus tyrosinisolvens TaxID=1443435 RepID=UPI00063FBA1C|nr:gamma-glutamyltransferase [Aneurinibacillus tyrosinisolvens]
MKSIIGTKTMVVSPHYLASMAGSRMLQKGGNAFDASVAISACLAVVYPHMTGLGGDSFWLLHSTHDKQIRAFNGSGRSGYKVTRKAYAGEDSIPYRGSRSAITVPRMVDSWDAILQEYGRLSLGDVLEPAIVYAATGFPLSKHQHENTVHNFSLLSRTPITSSIFTPNKRAPHPGERFLQRKLAKSLQEIASKGRDYFYKGSMARQIVSFLENNGGLLTIDDFADHQGDWVTPPSTTYRGHTIYQVPPNSQGFVGLMTLNILENYDFTKIEHGSFEYYHLLVEALKSSFHERNNVLTDPDFFDIPLEKLVSKEYAAELSQTLRFHHAKEVTTSSMGSDTAYAAVVDDEGNAISFIQSLYFEFGSAVVAGNTGILMQNRGSFFSLDPNHVNCLEPRWVWGRTWGEDSQELKIENRVDSHTIALLEQAGHTLDVRNDFDPGMGHAQAIRIDEQGFLSGGVDPRGDGAAIGW